MFEKLKQKYDKKLETDFLSEALEIVEKPASPLGHFIIWTTVAIVTATVIWACYGKMDEVAVASARVVPKDGVQVVQPLYEGVVTDILIEEGETVKKGQELIILDSTAEKIGMENSEAKIKELKLQNDLISLLLKNSDISDYAEKNNISNENEIQVIRLMLSMQNENRLAVSQFESQRGQYEKQFEIEKNTLEKLNKNLNALQQQKSDASALYNGSTPENQALENYKLQLENAEKEVGEYKKLYEIGAAAKYQLEEKQTALDEIKKQYELQQVRAEHESAGNSAELSELQREIDLLKKDISAQEKSVEKQEELRILRVLRISFSGMYSGRSMNLCNRINHAFTHYLFSLLSDTNAPMAAQPAKTNAIMKAWMTVFTTGAVSQGEKRQSNHCFHYSLNMRACKPCLVFHGFTD